MGPARQVVDVKWARWDRAKQYAGMATGLFVLSIALLSIIFSLMAFPFTLPVVVSGLCNLVLGLLMLCIQLNRFSGTISKYFGFLDMRAGRGLFYIFVGNNSLLSGDGLLHVVSFALCGCCWFVGLCELCGPVSRQTTGDAMLSPAAGMTQSADGQNITINLTPGQVAAGANMIANNSAAAWQAAVRANTGAAPSNQQSENPFFGAR